MTTAILERPAPLSRISGERLVQIPALVVVFALAWLARILPLLRGGGLSGYGSYDDSVYFASAVGLVHGRWPYRDFLLIQPPGIVVALTPFAFLTHFLGDAGGVAVSRLAWITLGSLTAVGLVWLLWRVTRVGAVVAGLFYAFTWPTGMVERVTDLEGAQNFLLVLALVLLRPFGPNRTRGQRAAVLLAGIAMGLAWSIKIWEIVPIAVILLWMMLRPHARHPRRFLLGAFAAVAVVCLPFFIAAPGKMWTMVVSDQLGRPWHKGWVKRLVYTTGTSHLLPTHGIGKGLLLLLLGLLIVLALALLRPKGGLFVLLYLAMVVVLLKSPPTYVHYGSWPAPALAIVIGLAIAEVIVLLGKIPIVAVTRAGIGVLAVGCAVILTVLAYSPFTAHAEAPAPTGAMASITAGLPGCITYDEPSEALSLNLVSRDLDRHCRFIVDLGAASHWAKLRPTSNARVRSRDDYALHYLRGGSAALLYRYVPGKHGSAIHIVGHWKLLARNRGLRLVQPMETPSGA